MSEITLTWFEIKILDAFAEFYGDSLRQVYPSMSSWHQRSLWLTRSEIERRMQPDQVQLATLRSMAKRGLLHETGKGRDVRFCTPTVFEEMEAENNLSEGERAERTADSIRKHYKINKDHYGDSVSLWGVSTQLAAVVSDGIGAALEGGLVRLVSKNMAERRYVPEEVADAYLEAREAQEAREERHKAYVKGLGAKMNEYLPAETNTRAFELSLDQLERIVEILEGLHQ